MLMSCFRVRGREMKKIKAVTRKRRKHNGDHIIQLPSIRCQEKRENVR